MLAKASFGRLKRATSRWRMLIQGETKHLEMTAADVTALRVSNLSFAECDMGWAAIVEHNQSRSLSGDANYKAAVQYDTLQFRMNSIPCVAGAVVMLVANRRCRQWQSRFRDSWSIQAYDEASRQIRQLIAGRLTASEDKAAYSQRSTASHFT
ncbi:uncharacterized protein UTRI_03267 [Ustilago trichophora]|uniref:Uncharacterized protein n=1 Tax=Ustilago trichophora TaxID=86804 RepID=A0A5C3E5V0_9BASI|nr:uncharacterized protein UTRI_03267 [Ustilago trichophora]